MEFEDIIDESVRELEAHGISVDEPEEAVLREEKKGFSSLLESSGMLMSAAEYKPALDRIDIFEYVAKAKAVETVFDDQTIGILVNSVEEKEGELPNDITSNFRSSKTGAALSPVSNSSGIELRAKQVVYDAIVNQEEIEPFSEHQKIEELNEAASDHLQFSTEHELIHKHGYDSVLPEVTEQQIKDLRRGYAELELIRKNDLFNHPYEEGRPQSNQLTQSKFDIEFEELEQSGRHPVEDEVLKAAAISYLDEWEQIKHHAKEDLLDVIGDSSLAHYRSANENRSGLPSQEALETYKSVCNSIFAIEEDEEAYKNQFESMPTRTQVESFLDSRGVNVEDGDIDELLKAEREYHWSKQASKHSRLSKKNEIDAIYNKLERESSRLAEENLQTLLESFGPAFDRLTYAKEVPSEISEAYAQTWTLYREKDIEDPQAREEIISDVRENYPEGEQIANFMNDILNEYDSLDQSLETSERVGAVISKQPSHINRATQL